MTEAVGELGINFSRLRPVMELPSACFAIGKLVLNAAVAPLPDCATSSCQPLQTTV